MKGIDREVLARDAAARLYAAACKESRKVWDEQERIHAEARSQAIARRAARPLLRICAGCPIITECRAWAETDRYTGIAAGAAWVNGVEKATHWVRRQATRRAAAG